MRVWIKLGGVLVASLMAWLVSSSSMHEQSLPDAWTGQRARIEVLVINQATFPWRIETIRIDGREQRLVLRRQYNDEQIPDSRRLSYRIEPVGTNNMNFIFIYRMENTSRSIRVERTISPFLHHLCVIEVLVQDAGPTVGECIVSDHYESYL